MGWFKKWSNFDSARSLGEWIFWAFCIIFNTTSAALIAAAAAYTHWYWESYGAIGVAFAFLISVIILPFGSVLVAYAALVAAAARIRWSNNSNLKERSFVTTSSEEIASGHPLDALSEIRQELDAKIYNISQQLAGDTFYGGKTSALDKIREDLAYEGKIRARSVEILENSIRGARDSIYESKKEISDIRDRLATIFSTKQTLEKFDEIANEVKILSDRLRQPQPTSGIYQNWEEWTSDFSSMKSSLKLLSGLVSHYASVDHLIFAAPEENYKSKYWSYDFIGMDENQKHDFKTFCLINRNFSDLNKDIRSKIVKETQIMP